MEATGAKSLLDVPQVLLSCGVLAPHLTVGDVTSLSCVCTRLRELLFDETLWRLMCRRDYGRPSSREDEEKDRILALVDRKEQMDFEKRAGGGGEEVKSSSSSSSGKKAQDHALSLPRDWEERAHKSLYFVYKYYKTGEVTEVHYPSHSGPHPYDVLLKACLLGDGSVGKTSWLWRLSHNEFPMKFNNTIGVEFQLNTYRYRQLTCKMQLWDSFGSDRYRRLSVNPLYRMGHVFLVLYDIRMRSSFVGARDRIKSIRDYLSLAQKPPRPIILCANKEDLRSEASGAGSSSSASWARGGPAVVTEEEGRAMAEEWSCMFVSLSAKAGLNRMQLLQMTLAAGVKHLQAHPEDAVMIKPKTPTQQSGAEQGTGWCSVS